MDRVALRPQSPAPGRAWLPGTLSSRVGLWITNLSDLVPWGLWITIDLSSIALSAGAFTLCAAVYLIGLKRYQPVARTATFVGLIGYTMAMLSLLLDIGRPDRFWHALVYWNDHSLLWEVTMCVMLYLTVLVFESMPIFASWSWLKKRLPRCCVEDERPASICAVPGHRRAGAVHAPSVVAGWRIRSAEGPPYLVQARDDGAVHVLSDHRRDFPDLVRIDAGLPADSQSQGERFPSRATWHDLSPGRWLDIFTSVSGMHSPSITRTNQAAARGSR